MGSNGKLKPLAPSDSRSSEEEEVVDEEEREIEELEREVEEMAEKIIQYRRTVPDRLSQALSSTLVAQRPLLPPHLNLGQGSGRISEEENQTGSSEGTSIAESDEEMLEKLRVFRAKVSSNIKEMPKVLKRMNDCIVRIDRVNQYNVNIHSVFMKKRRL